MGYYQTINDKYIQLSPEHAQAHTKEYFKNVFEKGQLSYKNQHYSQMIKMIEERTFSNPLCTDLISPMCEALLRVTPRTEPLDEAVMAEAADNMANALQLYYKENPTHANSFSKIIKLLAHRNLYELAKKNNTDNLVKFISRQAPSLNSFSKRQFFGSTAPKPPATKPVIQLQTDASPSSNKNHITSQGEHPLRSILY